MNQSNVLSPVCIVGMHRSGTSMIAGVLEGAGLHLGSESDLLGAEDANPKGHFENLRFVEQNETLLRELGGSWSEPPVRFHGWHENERWVGQKERAAEILSAVGRDRPWGWKDPRTTLLLPFWRSLAPNARFVVCLRSPLAVAWSLRKRDGFTLAKGGELWSEYTEAAIRDTAGADRLFVFYDDFVTESQRSMKKLLEFCGLPAAVDGVTLGERVAHELRHHVVSDEETYSESEIPARAKALHAGLVSLLHRPGTDTDGLTAEAERAIEGLAAAVERLADPGRVADLQQDRDRQSVEIDRLRWDLEQERSAGEQLTEDVQALSKHRDELQHLLGATKNDLFEYRDAVEGSVAFRMVKSIWKIRDALLPPGTGRRRASDRFFRRFKSSPAAATTVSLLDDRAESGSEVGTAGVVVRNDQHPAPEPVSFDAPLRRSARSPSPDDRPLVSIVVRTSGDRLGCLQEAVRSVADQDFPNLELVVVEDGSDRAKEWLAELELSPHLGVVYQSLPKVGRCLAGNRGMEIATGDYVGFLDDDDLLYRCHVSTLVEALEARSELAGAYGVAERVVTRVVSYTPFRYEESERGIDLREPFDRQDLWTRNLFPIQSVLFRRELFEEFGGFHPELGRLEDWDLWVRYSSRRDFALVDRVTSMYRVPATAADDERRQESMDRFFPLLRELQGRVMVQVSPPQLESLTNRIIDGRKYFRLARKLRLFDASRELRWSAPVQEFFSRAESDGSVTTTPREALELAGRVLLENPRLSLLMRVSNWVRRRRRLKGFVDRCYLGLERHL